MSFFTAIIQFFATIFSPLRHPGGGGGGGQTASDDLAQAEAKARQKRLIATVAVLVIIGSLISLYFTMIPAAPKINRNPFIGRGQVLAEETVKALNNQGRVVLVIADYYQQSGSPMYDELASFRSTLKGNSRIEVAATEVVSPDETMVTSGLSGKAFTEILKKHPSVSGLVLFLGMPELEDLAKVQLPTPRPMLIAVQNNASPSKPYFQQNIVDVLIVPRLNAGDATAANPTTPRGWFDKYFEVYTAKNYQSMPD
ncbi:MAG: hypothetical protein PCFJNLEI_04003 [Verrucomicrobiae bacterium]|nr:hypothetical protein [Verrucomicrobiae bacterium]